MYRLFVFLSLSLLALIYFLDRTKAVPVSVHSNTSQDTHFENQDHDNQIKNPSWGTMPPSSSVGSRFAWENNNGGYKDNKFLPENLKKEDDLSDEEDDEFDDEFDDE